ncbi:EthD family reductase [Massilia sp. R2A-15]|uniref:EthD family reductase n=1 Tax=Massilia sp. R2A-15 TaxID=3064278 RepID=UPI0027325C93|nr:EthD family reductase [Massilia sp. R2A-15]WLI89668.1 EthD family reductase [Massilia sp. R2A-15]
MIKVTAMYPHTPDARFDLSYYVDKHMPMVKDRFGAACTSYTIDKGVAGMAPGSAPTYGIMCHFFFDSLDAFQSAFAPHAQQILGDIPNYTDLTPVIQISEVLVG